MLENAFIFIAEASNLISATSRSTKSKEDHSKRIQLYVISGATFLFVLFVVCIVFLLLRRRKIYGGFYIFQQPPSPDHFSEIDPQRALIEQTNGLPYDPVWEFPRKRVKLRKFIFATVSLFSPSVQVTSKPINVLRPWPKRLNIVCQTLEIC